MAVPVYYELSWAILSSICIISCLIGCLVVSVAGLKAITSVPIVVSVAGAVANGLCFYANYTDAPVANQAIAGIFADITWMIQETGLSFYSYFILTNILKNTARRIFLSLFWLLVASVVVIRAVITTIRAISVLRDSSSLMEITMKVHHGYFILIFSLEALSAVFLLRSFSSARQASRRAPDRSFTLRLLVQQLILSTELRLAALCLIGVSRAILYAFRTTQQTATNVATQIDRFVYTVECLFPIVLMFDILAAKLIYARLSFNGGDNSSLNLHPHGTEARGNPWPPERPSSQLASPRLYPVSSSPLPVSKEDPGIRFV